MKSNWDLESRLSASCGARLLRILAWGAVACVSQGCGLMASPHAPVPSAGAAPRAAGGLVWATQAQGKGTAPMAVAANPKGVVVEVGHFTGTATFDPGGANETVLTSAGDTDIYVASYSGSGALSWATQAFGTKLAGTNSAQAVAVLADGTAVVTGFFRKKATFGKGEPNETVLQSDGDSDFFLARYDTGGGLLWARQGFDKGFNDYGASVAVLADGTIVVAGIFGGTLSFDPSGADKLDPLGGRDVFLARYDDGGKLLWAKRAGGSSDEQPVQIAVSPNQELLVVGRFEGVATFGEKDPQKTVLTSGGMSDVFVARYKKDGSLVWATQSAGTSEEWGHAIDVFSDGSSVVTGFYGQLSGGTAIFGAGAANQVAWKDATYESRAFVARFHDDGKLEWAKHFHNTPGTTDDGRAIIAFADGTAIVTGNFGAGGKTTFGPGEPGEVTLGPTKKGDVFLAGLRKDGMLAWVRTAEGPGFDSGSGLAALTGGQSFIVVGETDGDAVFGKGEANETPPLSDTGFIARYVRYVGP